jgi:hypothetical protein
MAVAAGIAVAEVQRTVRGGDPDEQLQLVVREDPSDRGKSLMLAEGGGAFVAPAGTAICWMIRWSSNQ